MRRVIFTGILFLSVWALSCGSNVKPVEPNLGAIQREIFNENCNAPSCHGSGMKGGLSLAAGKSYRQLVGIAGTFDKRNVPAFVRVLPGNPDSSFLYIKITAPDTNQGEVMPKGHDRLSQNKIDAIRQWILDGARDN